MVLFELVGLGYPVRIDVFGRGPTCVIPISTYPTLFPLVTDSFLCSRTGHNFLVLCSILWNLKPWAFMLFWAKFLEYSALIFEVETLEWFPGITSYPNKIQKFPHRVKKSFNEMLFLRWWFCQASFLVSADSKNEKFVGVYLLRNWMYLPPLQSRNIDQNNNWHSNHRQNRLAKQWIG